MEKLQSFFKKIFLCCALLSTQIALSGIDLQLHRKPRNVSTYNWCTERARGFVQQKRSVMLKMLNIANQDEWKRTKKSLEREYKSECLESLNEKEAVSQTPFDQSTRRCITNILKKPSVKRKFKITNIIDKGNIITVETAEGEEINFVKIENKEHPIYSTDQAVCISQAKIQSIALESEIEAIIGHELAHVLRKHAFEDYCMKRTYELNEKSAPDEKTFNEALYDFKRAYEIEADIVGTFNNLHLAQNLYDFFSKRTSPALPDKNAEHPSYKERATYMSSIAWYMKIEQAAKIQKRSKPRFDRQKRSAPKKVVRKKITPTPCNKRRFKSPQSGAIKGLAEAFRELRRNPKQIARKTKPSRFIGKLKPRTTQVKKAPQKENPKTKKPAPPQKPRSTSSAQTKEAKRTAAKKANPTIKKEAKKSVYKNFFARIASMYKNLKKKWPITEKIATLSTLACLWAMTYKLLF